MIENHKPNLTGKEPLGENKNLRSEQMNETPSNRNIQTFGDSSEISTEKEEREKELLPDDYKSSQENTIDGIEENRLETEDHSEDITVIKSMLSGEDEADAIVAIEKGKEEDIILPIPEAQTEEQSLPPSRIDYSILSKTQLIKEFEFLLESKHINAIRNEVENLKINFYKRHKFELEKKRKQFYEEGGAVDDFQPEPDELESNFKELYKNYRLLKAVHNRELEDQKLDNLQYRQKLLEELKELVTRKEDINRTFQEFRELQKKWRLAGMIPQHAVKDMWENYNLYVEQFYDHIKINKELRDLDLKKNLEAKIALCEKAEELILEPSILNAFRILQRYHDQWREIGPVLQDQKEVVWERFKEITYQINKKHQEYYDGLRDAQKRNFEAKTLLCEKAETIGNIEFKSITNLERLTKEMLELQKVWKTIGFAPKKDNSKIYQRFRSACDVFFTRKRDYNAITKDFMDENYQKKLDLCLHAESMQTSTDWKKTTDELISLQKKWKEIGPVPRKYHDSLWRRFRQACDNFFNSKSEHFSSIESKYEENLKKKTEIIEKIEQFDSSGNFNETLNKIKNLQREWTEIGYVPMKSKEEIQKRYRNALDRHFESLKIDDERKNLLKFKHKLDSMVSIPNVSSKINYERDKYVAKLKQLESDIVLWENNIGFFAKSKNAEIMVNEFKQKIEQGKVQIKFLEEKINMIDELDSKI